MADAFLSGQISDQQARLNVLNLIEAATGGRFHPNFNRIGGIKDDLPWGWISDCRDAMKRRRS